MLKIKKFISGVWLKANGYYNPFTNRNKRESHLNMGLSKFDTFKIDFVN